MEASISWTLPLHPGGLGACEAALFALGQVFLIPLVAAVEGVRRLGKNLDRGFVGVRVWSKKKWWGAGGAQGWGENARRVLGGECDGEESTHGKRKSVPGKYFTMSHPNTRKGVN